MMCADNPVLSTLHLLPMKVVLAPDFTDKETEAYKG